MPHPNETFTTRAHGTTILAVKRGETVALAGDGQITFGDVVMKHEMTPFLTAAAERGCRFQVGSDMLFEQIPAYLEFFGLPSTTPDVLRSLARLAGR